LLGRGLSLSQEFSVVGTEQECLLSLSQDRPTHTAGHCPEQHETNQQPYTPFSFSSIIIIIIIMNLSNV
jgi:hypothetical protein